MAKWQYKSFLPIPDWKEIKWSIWQRADKNPSWKTRLPSTVYCFSFRAIYSLYGPMSLLFCWQITIRRSGSNFQLKYWSRLSLRQNFHFYFNSLLAASWSVDHSRYKVKVFQIVLEYVTAFHFAAKFFNYGKS